MSLWKPKYKDSNGNIQDLQLATDCLTDGTHLVKLPTLSDNAKVLTTDLTETGQTLDFSVSTSSGDIYSDNVFGYRQTATPFAQSKVQTKSSVVNIQKARAFGFVKNQKITNPNIDTNDTWSKSSGTITLDTTNHILKFTASAQYGGFLQRVTFEKGHQYLITFLHKGTTGSYGIYTSGDGISFNPSMSNVTDTNFTFRAKIVNYTGDGGNLSLIFQDNRASDWTEQQFKEFRLVDLTQWFNNDTTILAKTSESWFIGWFLNNFGNKIPSTFESGAVDFGWAKKIKTTNENVWNEVWEVGSIDGSTGANDNSVTTLIRSKNYIDAIPNTTYYAYLHGYNARIFYYDKDKNFIGYDDRSGNGTFTTPTNCIYVRFRLNTAYGTTYKHDITINLSNNSINGTYFKHEEWLFEMDWSFANSGSPRGINSTCGDEKDFVNGKNRVAVKGVDLGSLNWEYDSTYSRFKASLPLIKIAPIRTLYFICSLYITSKAASVSEVADKSVYNGNNEAFIYIHDSSYTDAAVFKSAMSGVMLYYELATPTETDMTESEKTFNSYIVNTNGTEQLLDENDIQTVGLLTNFYLENDTKQIFNNLNEINGLISNYYSIPDKYLPLSGGTMTGTITLPNAVYLQGKATTLNSPLNIIGINASNNLSIGDLNLGYIVSQNNILPGSAISNTGTLGTNARPWNAIYGNYISGDTFEATSYYNTYGESVNLTNAYVVTDDEDDAYETRYGLRAIKNITSNGTYKLTIPEKTGTIATMADVEGTLVEIVDLTTLA